MYVHMEDADFGEDVGVSYFAHTEDVAALCV
jgi:hypothetical protein